MLPHWRNCLRSSSETPYPMVQTQWVVGDRIVYNKRDGYWQNGDDGQPLPYLDSFTVRYIPDSGHFVQQEQPDLVNRWLLEFLG